MTFQPKGYCLRYTTRKQTSLLSDRVSKNGQSGSQVDRSHKLKVDHNLRGSKSEAGHEIFRRPQGLHSSQQTPTHMYKCVRDSFLFSLSLEILRLFCFGSSTVSLSPPPLPPPPRGFLVTAGVQGGVTSLASLTETKVLL